MFCSNCGASLSGTPSACPLCGAAVATVSFPHSAAPATASTPVPAAAWSPAPQTLDYSGQQETDGKAVGSLVLGILSLIGLWLVAGIPAVILGHLAKSNIRKSMGRLKGDGLATAGLIMGYLSVATLPVVVIIASIAIPSLLRSRMVANESTAASTLRVINSAQATYASTYPNAGFARDLATLGPGGSAICSGEGTQEHACLIDRTLGCRGPSCIKYGYQFKMVATCGGGGACTDYVVLAVPASSGSTGTKSFCTTSDTIIRVRPGNATFPTPAACHAWPPISQKGQPAS
ncbi:MAG TPA: DUF4190 domain-containing protein [Candidatus Angelobacter sp.]|nr:DUF4190 domain-containing protein [Candidatus Angelobacter sp.]